MPLRFTLEVLKATGGDMRVVAAVVLMLRGSVAAAPADLAAAARELAAAGVNDKQAFGECNP